MLINKNNKTIFAWSMYDFANQPYTTLVITFIYSTYFAKAIAPNEIIGTALWSRAMTITALTVAFLSPIMGAVADKTGHRKLFLIFWTYVCIVGSFALYYPLPGEIYKALFWVVISNVGFEMGGLFCNAYLPDIAPKDKIGRISGYGWSLGYLGGLIALGIGYVFLVSPENPMFGFSKELGENIRATNIMVAIWFIIFSIPVFMGLSGTAKLNKSSSKNIWSDSFLEIKSTFSNIKKYKELVKFLIARIFYNDGLITIIAFGGIYAAGTFNFTFEDIFLFGIVLNITAGLGAFALGFLDDMIGGKKTVQVSNVGLIFACLLAVFTKSITVFWFSGILIGIFMGSNQAASRSLMARFIPENKENEFFGFFAFTGKATAFLGPLLLGIVTQVFNSQRHGIFVVVVLLLTGFFLMSRVNEKVGISQKESA
jgi:UMF1 family MFS transporter